MPRTIQVVITHAMFTCLDCGHAVEFLVSLKMVKEQCVIYSETCPACKSENYIGEDIEVPAIYHNMPDEEAAP